MRYSVVELDFGDDETKNFGNRKEFASLTSLYEIKTLATISGDFDVAENEDPDAEVVAPDVFTSSNEKWLAVAIGDDISIFSVDFDIDYVFTQPFKGGSDIRGIGWLGDSHFLVVVTASWDVTLISAELKTVITNFAFASNSSSLRAYISSCIVDDECVLVVSNDHGESITMIIPNWNKLVNAKMENLAECCKESFSAFSVSQGSSGFAISEMFCCGQSIILAPAKGGPLVISGIGEICFQSIGENDYTRENTFIRLRGCCNGRFLIGLTVDGRLIAYDFWTYTTLFEKPLITSKNEIIIDFLFIDKPLLLPSFSSIAVIVRTADGLEMQVRSFSNLDVTYSVIVRDNTAMLPTAETADRVIMLIEPFHKDKKITEDDVVKVREISEAQPEIRLHRLISRNQLDEAEKFAHQFKLDLQKVNIARMNFLLSKVSLDDSQDVFSQLMKCFDAVNDHNLVGETCFAGATTFGQYDRIITLLSYAKKRAITDVDTIERLSRLSYVLATYRLMMGPENANYGPDSLWENFVEGAQGEGEWPNLFRDMLSEGLIKEARVLWNRHNSYIAPEYSYIAPNSIEEESTMQSLSNLFSILNSAISNNLSIWRDVIGLLEFDVVPMCLSGTAKQMCPLLVDFLLSLARRLELLDSSNFPLNALHTTSTFDRILDRLVKNTITSSKQAELAFAGSVIITETEGYQSRIGELDTYSTNLRAINRLKIVYDCPLSYETYVTLDSEKICHKILQNAIRNPIMMKVNVEKFARPYMAEHKLQPDETLYRYIEDVSKHSKGVVSASNPWDEQCLLVSETIASLSLRCKAVSMIARGAHPPWSKRLSETVQGILNNPQVDADVVKLLRSVCWRAELGQILKSYSVQIAMLDSILTTEYVFLNFLRYMFLQEQTHPDDGKRLQDALKAVDIYCRLYEGHSSLLTHKWIYVMFGQYLQKRERVPGTGSNVSRFIERMMFDCNESNTMTIICLLTDAFVSDINSMVVFEDKEHIDERLHKLSSAESLIVRFLMKNEFYVDLYRDLCAVRKLQENYNMWITCTHLKNRKWKEQTLKEFMVRDERSLGEVYSFASALRLNRDESTQIAIKLAIDAGNSMGALTIIRDALMSIPFPSKELSELCVRGCEFTLWRMQETTGNTDQDHAIDTDAIEQAMDIIYELARILPNLEPATRHSIELQEAVIRMHGYTNLFLQLEKQCMMDESDIVSGKSDVEKQGSDRTPDEDGRIMGLRQRLGIYQIRNEGPLFARMETIPQIASVAKSVIRINQFPDIHKEQLCSDLQMRWHDVFNFLSLSNQDLLEVCCRVFAASLPCFNTVLHEIEHGLLGCVRNVCIRALQMHPCDLWTTCGLLGAFSTDVIESMVKDLRQWVANRKSPQTMLNFLRTVQFVTVHTQTKDIYKMLLDTFITTLWAKRLGKVGVSPALAKSSSSQNQISATIAEFAKHELDPCMVAEFIGQFRGDNELALQLRNYAIVLIQRASSSSDSSEINSLLQCAHQALRINQVQIDKQSSFSAFRDALYTVCPYNYSVILFIVARLEAWQTTDDDKIFVTGCISILNFLTERDRQNGLNKAEFKWYTNREKQMSLDKKEMGITELGGHCRNFYENGTVPSTCNSSGSSMVVDEERVNLYEREDMLVAAMPSQAVKQLPFHPFLYHARSDIEQHLVPIIETEIDIYNVLCWQTLVRVVPWLRTSLAFPRSLLLSSAVGKKSADVIAKGQDLSIGEASTIEALLMQTTSRNAVVTCISMCFRKLPLCDTKIRLLQMGKEVAERWLNAPNVDPPMNNTEREGIEEQVIRLHEAIEKYRTELILKKSGLYDEKTSDLIESPTDLICYLYSNCINWKERGDRERKMAVIEELAAVNKPLILATIQEELVLRWLPADNSDDAYAVDPNDTVGNVGGISAVIIGENDENEVYRLPFFDVSIERIVHLLKLIDMTQVMMHLVTLLRKDASTVSGGYKTIIRAACVLLRAYNDKQLEKVKYNHLKICSELEAILYGRLLEMARVDIPLDNFRKQDKHAVARGLASPGTRWTPELAYLVACLVIDYEIKDRVMVDVLLNRLQAAQKKEIYVALLNWCRQEKSLHRVKNLPLLWARAFDWSLASVDVDEADVHALVQHWFYFAISCPVEGGRAFDSISNALKGRGYPIAAYLISVVGAYTQKCPVFDFSSINSEQELLFGWMSNEINVEDMETNV